MTADLTAGRLSNPLALWADTFTRAGLAADVWVAATGTPASLASRRAARLNGLIERVRQQSPLFRQRWAELPPAPPLDALPVVTKAQLMAGFDQWASDPEVNLRSIRAFTHDLDRVGADYLGRYTVFTSSGTTGCSGIFVQPASALAIYDALLATRCSAAARAASLFAPPLPAVMIAALDGHYAGISTWRRLQRNLPFIGGRMHALSVKQPLDALVAALNRIQPRFLSSYPTVLQSLADERMHGTLRIAPDRIWSGGECLSPQARRQVELAFECPVINDYGASECISIAFECVCGQQHLNADWVVLEAVDRDYQPVPPGQASHTTLLTNLANPLQPIIRYDLGDSVTFRASACPCGSVLPAFEVAGRAADVLVLQRRDGSRATVVPLALQSAVEEATRGPDEVTLFQIVQTGPATLQLRTGTSRRRARRASVAHACDAVHDLLARHGLAHVAVQPDSTPIQREAGSGKLRQVIALPAPQ